MLRQGTLMGRMGRGFGKEGVASLGALTAAARFLASNGPEGLTMFSSDDSMKIVSTVDVADNYEGTPGAKLTTTRASSAMYWDASGVLQSASSNVLRRDFDPRLSSTTERCGYLIEEARTNQHKHSQDFSQSSWVSAGFAITSINNLALDGTNTACLITPAAGSASHYTVQSTLGPPGVTTASIYAKHNAGSYRLRVAPEWMGSGTPMYVDFNLSNGTVDTQSNATGTITAVGGGWYRCTATATVVTTTWNGLYIVSSAGTVSWDTLGAVSCYLWQSQNELGSFASSPIPTTTATVTRAADLVTLAGTLFPLSQTEGTLYAKVMVQTASGERTFVALDDATSNELNWLGKANSTNKAAFVALDGGVVQTNLASSASLSSLTQYKAAAAYKLNNSAAALIGETVQSDNGCTMPTTTRMGFGAYASAPGVLNGWLFEAAYFPTRKTNSQLQALASGYASDALLLMGAETQGLTFSATDQSMSILDTGTPANAYTGELSAKLGSIRTSAGMTYLSSGLLGWGPENLVVRSNDFSTGWTIDAGGVVVLAGQALGPDGAMSLSRFTAKASADPHYIYQNCGNLANKTHTVYARKGTADWISLSGDGPLTDGVYFNLNTGVKGTEKGTSTGRITDVGGGLYRCEVTLIAETFITIGIHSADNQSHTWTAAGTETIFAGFCQSERAASASTYKPTTSAAYYGLRLDYDSRLTGGPGYLVEEARTNLALRSQEIDNASWNKTGITVTANSVASPDGTTTADLLTTTAVAASIDQSITITTAAYTWSVYLKKGTAAFAILNAYDGGNRRTWINLTSGAVGTNAAGNTTTVQDVGSGWWRVIVSRTAGATGGYHVVELADADASAAVTVGVTAYVWGAQLEAGAFATSYVPTTSSTVTRAADRPLLVGTALPLSQTAGTLVARHQVMSTTSPNQYLLTLDDNTTNEFMGLRAFTDGNPYFSVTDGGASQASIDAGTTVASALKGFAAAYAANDFAASYDGGAAVTDSAGTLPTTTQIVFGAGVGAGSMCGWLRHGRYFPTRKSNADLAILAAAA